MPPNSRHLATITSLAIERAAFSRPGPDGRMQPTTAADVQSILEQIQSRGSGGRGSLLGYAGDHQSGLWDEPAHPRESTAHDGKKPGEFAPGGEGGDLPEPALDPAAAHKARLADSGDYYAAYVEWQQETATAQQAFNAEHADWQRATDAYAKYETDHKAWDARDTERTARKETLDEADPIGAAEKAIEATFEATPEPDWDLNQEDPHAHYRARVAPFADSFAKAWDEHFGAKGQVRAALLELGTNDKGLAKFDRAAAKGRASLEKSAEKYKAAAGKYLDYQVRADEEKAKFEGMEEPEAPDEPTLDEPIEPDRDDFETDEEYDEAQSAYEAEKKPFDDAWDEYEKADAQHEKASAAYQKASEKVGAMDVQAEKLAGLMDEHKESLETAWDEALESLKEEQGEIAEKLTATIDKEAEKDEEPDEVDEPGDEPEFEPPEAPDPNDFEPDEESEEDEPDEEDDEEEEEPVPHHRRGAMIPYGATPLQAGLMSLAEGVFELLARPSAAPVVHVAPAAAPVVHVAGPPPAQEKEEEPGVPKLYYRDPNGVMVAYDRERFLENTLEGLADTMTHLVEALSRPPPTWPAPVIHLPEQPAPVVNVQPPVENPLAYAREKDLQATLDRLSEAIEEMVRANTRPRRRRLLRDTDGEVTGSVEE